MGIHIQLPTRPFPNSTPDISEALAHIILSQEGEVQVQITDTFMAQVWLQPTIPGAFVSDQLPLGPSRH